MKLAAKWSYPPEAWKDDAPTMFGDPENALTCLRELVRDQCQIKKT